MDTHCNLQPSPFLTQNIGILPRGRALDIAMGNGRNTVYLAKNGFDVEGVDISQESVNAALEKANSEGVKIKTAVTDIEAGEYRIEESAYDLIICFNYLHRPLMPQIKGALKKGGIVVYETYTVDQLQFGKPSNRDFLLEYNELLKIFADFRCLRYFEGITDAKKATAGIIARKT
ncbi:MAG: class I SAM-dependent methyltransferase [Dehalococcoidales bacterium]